MPEAPKREHFFVLLMMFNNIHYEVKLIVFIKSTTSVKMTHILLVVYNIFVQIIIAMH